MAASEGSTLNDSGATLQQVLADGTHENLKRLGFTAEEVHNAGIRNLKAAGFVIQEALDADIQNLKAAGFAVEEVCDIPIQNLKAAGFALEDVCDANIDNLEAAGFAAEEVNDARLQNIEAAGLLGQYLHGTWRPLPVLQLSSLSEDLRGPQLVASCLTPRLLRIPQSQDCLLTTGPRRTPTLPTASPALPPPSPVVSPGFSALPMVVPPRPPPLSPPMESPQEERRQKLDAFRRQMRLLNLLEWSVETWERKFGTVYAWSPLGIGFWPGFYTEFLQWLLTSSTWYIPPSHWSATWCRFPASGSKVSIQRPYDTQTNTDTGYLYPTWITPICDNNGVTEFYWISCVHIVLRRLKPWRVHHTWLMQEG